MWDGKPDLKPLDSEESVHSNSTLLSYFVFPNKYKRILSLYSCLSFLHNINHGLILCQNNLLKSCTVEILCMVSYLSFRGSHCTKIEVSCGFGHIYWRNPWWKTFFVQRVLWVLEGQNPTKTASINFHWKIFTFKEILNYS